MNKKLRPTQINQWTKNAALEERGYSPLIRMRDMTNNKTNQQQTS